MKEMDVKENINLISSFAGSRSRIFLIGFMGSGKTYNGRLLANQLHIPFFDLDEEVEKKEGKSISKIFEQQGEEHFRQLESEMLQQVTETNQSFVLSTGGGTPCYFNSIDFMKKNGVVVWIDTPVDTLVQRLEKEKEKRPLLHNLSKEQLQDFVIKKLGDRKNYYQQASVVIKEDNFTPDQLIQTILKKHA